MTIKKETYTELKQIKQNVLKSIKWEEDVAISVKVYDCSENDEQTYSVEINVYVNNDYKDGWTNDIFYGIIEDDKINAEAEKNAVKRAKAVLRTVKGWFENKDEIDVENGIEVYHV